MGATRKLDLDRRLEAYFATLRSSSLREALKRSAGNWQTYAAVTGSAMAMATSASAAAASATSGWSPSPAFWPPNSLRALRTCHGQTPLG